MKWILTFFLWCLAGSAFGATYEERAVASVLMGEAWSDGTPGMTAVADVIRQRSFEKHLTPVQVVTAHRGKVHAFSCLNDTSLDRLIRKYSVQRDFPKALRLAQLLYRDPGDLPSLVGAANHYTRTYERPYWARGHRPVAIVGSQAFYRLDRY